MGMALDEPQVDEKTVPVNGLDVLISDDVRPWADSNRIDYVRTPDGEGFIIEPQSGGQCC